MFIQCSTHQFQFSNRFFRRCRMTTTKKSLSVERRLKCRKKRNYKSENNVDGLARTLCRCNGDIVVSDPTFEEKEEEEKPAKIRFNERSCSLLAVNNCIMEEYRKKWEPVLV